ncbi:MAG TPA: glycosyltransferase family 4 protein [Gaiellaceae bacterium]|nr:glycosyltransferase family 4 protein [Gaiellaceae bacterium]
MRPIRVLTVLTFYYPHWTGLTAHATRIAEGLVTRGHEVTVIAAQHSPELPLKETVNGVSVVRLPPVARLSRGWLTPSLPWRVQRLARRHHVIHFHTPLPEAPVVAGIGRVLRKPIVMTHQGDLVMPAGFANQAMERLGTGLLTLAGHMSSVVSPLNKDYASASTFLQRFDGKLVPILPPVEIPIPDQSEVERWRSELGLEDRKLIGFAGRFVEEKGFDFLLHAIPELVRTVPGAHLVYAGEHQVVYEKFFEKCAPFLEANRDHVTFVGLIQDPRRLANFYAMCDVFALPSRTDCFASVQVEAMLCGTPVVAADIPGARVPVRTTRMGVLVEPRDPSALAAGIRDVLMKPSEYRRTREEIRTHFDPVKSIDAYEELFTRLTSSRR